MLSHLSLFTGIGGIDLAAEWAGFHTVGQCEINPYCNMVLEKRFPDIKRWTDVKKLTGTEIVNTIGIPTLISGGFPCQPHSAAGKRKASGDDRDLWPELRRILCEVKPRWFVAENVAGLRSSEKGEFFGKILNDLASMGYRVGWGSWEAAHLNAPHHRERLFIVAHSIVNDNRPKSGTIPEEGGVPENNREALHSRMPIGTDCNNNAEDTLCQRRRGRSNGDSPGCECSLQIEGPDCNAPNSNHNGSGACGHGDDRGREACCQERGGKPFGESCRQDTDVADTQQGKLAQRLHVPGNGWFEEHIKEQWRDSWYEVATCFCGVDDGLPHRLDKHRTKRLQCLGNAVVPAQVYPLLKEIADYEKL